MELNNEFRVSVPVEQAWSVLTDLERIAPCMPGAELKEVEGDEYRGVVKVKVGPITAQYRGTARFVELDEGGRKAVLKAEGRDTRGQGNASATVVAQLNGDGDSTQVTITTDLAITGKVAQFGRGVLADVSGKLLDQFVERLEADVISGAGGPGPAGAPATTPTAPSSGAKVGPEEGAVGSSSNGQSSKGPASGTPASGAPASSGPASSGPASSGPASSGPASSGPASSGPAGEERPTIRAINSRPAEPVDLIEAAGGSLAKRLVPAGIGVLLLLLVWRLVRRR